MHKIIPLFRFFATFSGYPCLSSEINCRRCSGGLPTVEALGVAAKACGFAGWFFDRRLEAAATTPWGNQKIVVGKVQIS